MDAGRAHHLDADGVRVYAVEWVPSSAAVDRRIFLIHGLGANTLSWLPFGRPLADSTGATVTAIDLVGFGRTRAPEREASLGTNRKVVTALLDELGPATIFGNSMGGVVGTGVTARRPELVEALVLVNPALPWGRLGVGDWLRAARFAPLMMPALGGHAVAARARFLGAARVVDATLSISLHEPERLDAGLRDELVALASERYAYGEAPRAYADAARSLLWELGRGMFDRDLAAASASRPTLLVHGVEDRVVPVSRVHTAREQHGDVTVALLDGVGHAPQLEAPDRLLEVATGWLDARMGSWRRDQAGATSARPAASSGSRSEPSSAT
jgi:pimeloyl-ACP methyl ester carboxylesterase